MTFYIVITLSREGVPLGADVQEGSPEKYVARIDGGTSMDARFPRIRASCRPGSFADTKR